MKKLLLVLTIFCMILPSCKKTTITLSVDKTEITADGVDVAKFKVIANDEDDVTKDARIFFSDTNKEVGGTTFSTTEPKTYSFYATYEDATSEKVTVTAVEVTDEGGDDDGNDDENTDDENTDDDTDDDTDIVEGTITLSASADTILADGKDLIKFTAVQDSADVTSLAKFYVNDSLLSGNEFATTVAGSYSVVAKKNDTLVSNEITFFAKEIIVEEPEEPVNPIELAADKTTIVADGKDAITFTVKQNDNDVTTESEIYVNGSKLKENKFVTYTAGTFKAYAKKGDVKSNEITITVNAAPDSGKTILFAEGVTTESGWYDVNKKGNGQQNGDINMCWAATSSNIIQWWQDRYVAAGNTLPDGAVTGPGKVYELALMEVFHNQWDNSKGGDAAHGITWYFEGRNIWTSMSDGTYAQPLEGNSGGYFASVWNEILPHVYHEYTHIGGNNLIVVEVNNYYEWGNASGLTNPDDRLARFSELLVEFMGRGMCGLSVATNASFSSSHHSVTLWGCEYDNTTGIVTKVWISDSDDMKSEPKNPVLHECTVSMEGGAVKFSDAAEPYYAVGLYPVSGYGSR